MTSSPSKTTTSRYVTRNHEILEGEPIVEETRVAVRDIVELWKTGVRPEDIPVKLPFVTAAQVFDAISFYLDNQSEIDEYIEYFRERPWLNVPVGLRANPLLDEVAKYVEAYHSEQNAVIDWDESEIA